MPKDFRNISHLVWAFILNFAQMTELSFLVTVHLCDIHSSSILQQCHFRHPHRLLPSATSSPPTSQSYNPPLHPNRIPSPPPTQNPNRNPKSPIPMALRPPLDPRLHLPSSCPHRRPLPRPFRVSASSDPARIAGALRVKSPPPLRFDRLLSPDDEGAMGDGFFEAIEELERMVRDPSDVLGGMAGRLSDRELQLVLVYFSQEGRDSYCALEVFDWLRRENRVDGETMELMVSIACGWIDRMIVEGHGVGDVVGLLNEMDCVGLEPRFSMVEKVVELYWGRGKRDDAVDFVKDVMRRGGVGGHPSDRDGGEGGRGGPVGYLAWKMMEDGNYPGAIKLVVDFKKSGLKPGVYSYLIAMTALLKEQKELSKVLRKLKASLKDGLIAYVDEADSRHIEKYQSDLISDGVRLSDWAIEEGGSKITGAVHERLLAIYTCAGCGVEAEHHLWQMKLLGKEPDREIYDAVLAICASKNEAGAVGRLLAGAEASGADRRKKTFSWLLRGYIKGGYYVDASETLMKMLDLGLCPDYLDRVVVLQGLRRNIQESGNTEPYMKLCKRLSDLDLVGPCLVYMYMHKHKLWIMRTI